MPAAWAAAAAPPAPSDILRLDNHVISVGVDRAKGGAITWLASADGKNRINASDPGRLIQQSYYAGKSLDRRAEGQSKAWSPWPWNPIQGGGVGSWARVTEFRRLEDQTLQTETVPRLWDMPAEEAAARMRQWTTFEPDMPNVVAVRCECRAERSADDPWGPAVPRAQEIPACYFTRNFATIKSYLGAGAWREEATSPGPPWTRAKPPRNAMAVFARDGRGVALFSPGASQPWNFGPVGGGESEDSTARPCVHVAAIDRVNFGPQSTYHYRFWLIVGDEVGLAARLDALWARYSSERAELQNP